MLKYILKRLAIFIPTLFAISVLAFAISVNSPGDPVEIFYSGAKGGNGEGANAQNQSMIRGKQQLRHQLGLDLPVFYFTLTSYAYPDTLYKISDPQTKETLDRLISEYGNWNEISLWYHSLLEMKKRMMNIIPDSISCSTLGKEIAEKNIDDAQQEINALFLSYEEVVIQSKFDKLQKLMRSEKQLGRHSALVVLDEPLTQCRNIFASVKNNSTSWKTWIPALHFYGYNQYHRWLLGDGNPFTGNGAVNTKGVVRGDFGRSCFEKLPVSEIIGDALPWSLFFTLTSVLLAYLVSIPAGVRAAARRGGIFDRGSSIIFFMLYSLPVFFLATLLMITFANPHVFDIFPAHGVMPGHGYPDGISLWGKIKLSLPYIILPLICYTYSSLAFLSRTMRVSMLEVISQDYMRTANAKGLSYFRVIYKHGMRNALLPIITIFSNIFPIAVGGSVIIEVIFGIPGMGQKIFDAIGSRDYTMIVAVFTLSGFMTLVGYLVADILYAVADPRISYSK
ncbi:MAG: ABC transporter permease [Bacteroidetes bacterium]|nr:ABC transporter permease [Bacteroidota bacterium]